MQKESKLKNMIAEVRDISSLCYLGCLIYSNLGIQKLKKKVYDFSHVDYIEERDDPNLYYRVRRIPKYKK